MPVSCEAIETGIRYFDMCGLQADRQESDSSKFEAVVVMGDCDEVFFGAQGDIPAGRGRGSPWRLGEFCYTTKKTKKGNRKPRGFVSTILVKRRLDPKVMPGCRKKGNRLSSLGRCSRQQENRWACEIGGKQETAGAFHCQMANARATITDFIQVVPPSGLRSYGRRAGRLRSTYAKNSWAPLARSSGKMLKISVLTRRAEPCLSLVRRRKGTWKSSLIRSCHDPTKGLDV